MSFDLINRVQDRTTREALRELAVGLAAATNPTRYAFRAHQTVQQNFATSGTYQATFDVVDFDLAGEYDVLTSSFIPLNAGYYLISSSVSFVSAPPTGTTLELSIYEDGTSLQDLYYIGVGTSYGPQLAGVDIFQVKPGSRYQVLVRVPTVTGGNKTQNNGGDTWFAAVRLA